MPVTTHPPPRAPGAESAIVVLGCRVMEAGPSPALTSRLERCLALVQGTSGPILLCGGKQWAGETEASAMRTWLLRQGVPGERLHLEDVSQTTWENVQFARTILIELGIRSISLVTSDFHMKRAVRLFRRLGFEVHPAPARSSARALARVRNWLREWGARRLEWVEEWRR